MIIMRMMLLETKQIFQDWLLWIIVIVCLILNGIMIISGNSIRNDYYLFEEMLSITGPAITEESIAKLEKQYNQEIEVAKKLYQERMSADASDLQSLYEKGCIDEQSFYRLQLWEQYLLQKETLLLEDNTFGTEAFKQSRSILFTKQIENFEKRVSQVNSNSENKFYSGAMVTDYWHHLYSKLLPLLYTEFIIIAVYTVLKNTEREFSVGTQTVVFSTRKGRNIHLCRMGAYIMVITILFTLVATLSLCFFYMQYPQTSMLANPVSAHLFPSVIPKINFSGLEYLLANLLIGYGVVLVFLFLAGGVGLLLNNSYVGTLCIACVVGGMALMQYLCQDTMVISNLLLAWNPLSLIVKITNAWDIQPRSGTLFLYTADCYSAPCFELGIIVTWLLITILLYGLCVLYFRRKEIPA